MYNFLLSNDVKGKALIPANICETVPAAYLKAGVDICFCDIDFGTWLPDEKQIWAIIEENPDITVMHYNRTYGCEANRERFFHEIHLKFPKVIIVDDRCLAIPFQSGFAESDLVLYSTGKTKPVNVGKYAFGYLKRNFTYTEYSLEGDIVSCEKAFDDSIKYCHAYHTPADMKVMLSNWMNPKDVPDEDYYKKIEVEYNHIIEHKRKINSIYSVLPDVLPNEYQNWRFNILVSNQEDCLKALFAAGLFASKHYMSLGNGYFSDVKTPSIDWLEAHVINLFNDNCYTEEMAYKTVDILKKVAKRL